MQKPRVKIKVKKGRGKHAPAKIKARFVGTPYIGDEAMREKMRADSLQKELDTLKCQLKVIIQERQQ